MSDGAVVYRGVTRHFGKTIALTGLDLTVEPGSVVGLIGRNGAGKTTALRLAHGVLHPDAGEIRVLGLDPVRQGREIRERASLLSEESALYPWMTVDEIMRFTAGLHPRWDDEFAREIRDKLELDPKAKIKTLSRGSRAKVALVLAVAVKPELLLLDDPTAGLDPLVRREVLEGILEAVPAEGGAVVYASHLVHDVERVSDRVAVLDRGRLVLEGGVEELKKRVRRAVAVFEGDPPLTVEIPGRIDTQTNGRVLSVVTDHGNGDLAASLRGLGATSVEIEPLSLEEILVACLRGGREREADHA
jgi:ABC-2 type transport system ATP-binding protein